MFKVSLEKRTSSEEELHQKFIEFVANNIVNKISEKISPSLQRRKVKSTHNNGISKSNGSSKSKRKLIEPEEASIETNIEEASKLTEAEEIFLDLVRLAKDPNYPLITLETIADILAQENAIKSNEQVFRIIDLLTPELDAVYFIPLIAALIPRYVTIAVEGDADGADIFRNERSPLHKFIIELMKLHVKDDQPFVDATLLPKFRILTHEVLKNQISLILRKESDYEIYKDKELIKFMIQKGSEYVADLERMRKGIDEIPVGIRADCNAVLQAIIEKFFPNGKPSKNPSYDNPHVTNLPTGKKVPRAALGIMLLYLNLRLMTEQIRQYIADLQKNGFHNCFTDDELGAGLDELQKQKLLKSKQIKDLINSETPFVETLNQNPEIKSDLIKRFTKILKKNPEQIANPFILYLIAQNYYENDKNKDLKFVMNVQQCMNATYNGSVNFVVLKFRQKEIDFNPKSAGAFPKLAFKIFQKAYEPRRVEYRHFLATLAAKSLTTLLEESKLQPVTEIKDNDELLENDISSSGYENSSEVPLSKSGSQHPSTGTGESSQIKSRQLINISAHPIWHPLQLRLLECKDIPELKRIILDSKGNLPKISKSQKSYHAELLRFFKPEKKTGALEDASLDPNAPIYQQLEALSKRLRRPILAVQINEIYKKNPDEFIEFFQDKLNECMTGLAEMAPYFNDTYNPFFQFARKNLPEAETEKLINALQTTITNHKLNGALKFLLRGKQQGLGIGSPRKEKKSQDRIESANLDTDEEQQVANPRRGCSIL